MPLLVFEPREQVWVGYLLGDVPVASRATSQIVVLS